MHKQYPIPFFGQAYTGITFNIYNTGQAIIRPYPFDDFCMQLADDGLESFGISPGDYLLFRKDGRASEESLILASIDDEYIVRQITYTWSDQPILRTPGDIYSPLPFHAFQGRIEAVMSGALKNDSAIERISINEHWRNAM